MNNKRFDDFSKCDIHTHSFMIETEMNDKAINMIYIIEFLKKC